MSSTVSPKTQDMELLEVFCLALLKSVIHLKSLKSLY